MDELARTTSKLAAIDDPGSLLSSLFVYAPVAFEVYDAEGHCLITNQAAHELFGSTPPPNYNIFKDNIAEAMGMSKLVQRAFDGETVRLPPVWYDARSLTHVSVEGRPVAVEITLFPLRDAKGEVRHVGICHKDVTSEMELRSVEASLREAQESLSTLLASMADGVIATDNSGLISRLNPIAEQLTGWKNADALERPVEDVLCIAGADAPAPNPVREVLAGRAPALSAPIELTSRDGVRRCITLSAAPIRDREQRVQGVVLVLHDVTERRRAELDLRRNEARYRSLIESTAALVWVTDTNGKVLSIDDGWVGYTELNAADFSLQVFAEALHPEDRARVTSALEGALQSHRAVDLEARLLHARSQRFRSVSVRMAPVSDASGVVCEWIGTIVDVDDRRRALDEIARLGAEARQMAEASRLKSDFLARMSHELRTPLNAILGFAELINDGLVPLESVRREFMGHILGSGRHLSRLIDDVLDLAKVEAGKMVVRPERANIEEVVNEVCSIVLNSGFNPYVTLFKHFPEGNLEVVIDVHRFKQVLFNYLSNALKFARHGGCVTVRILIENDEYFRLEVEDDGPGISEADQGELFMEFHQLGEVGTRKHRGTGLGLAVTKRIVEAQGGQVAVRSKVGSGSIFSAVLPRMMSASRAASIAPSNGASRVRS